jgi:hypothetical protein
MPVIAFGGIVSITVTGCDARIRADGTITGVTKAEKSGTTLKLTGRGGSGGGHLNSITQMNSFGGGGSVMTIGNLRMTTNRDGVSSLEGPADTRIEINGHETTYGQIVRWCQGGSTLPQPAAAAAAAQTYKIESSTVREIECTGTGGLAIAAEWVALNLSVSLRGSGDVELPRKAFDMLNLSLMGSGDIYGENETATRAQTLVASLMGSGDIKDITVLGTGSLSLMGSGDISILAVDPSAVTRSRVGTGRIGVGRAHVPPVVTRPTSAADADAVLTSFLDALRTPAKAKPKAAVATATTTAAPTSIVVRDMGADDVEDLIAAQPERKRERESSPGPSKRAKK